MPCLPASPSATIRDFRCSSCDRVTTEVVSERDRRHVLERIRHKSRLMISITARAFPLRYSQDDEVEISWAVLGVNCSKQLRGDRESPPAAQRWACSYLQPQQLENRASTVAKTPAMIVSTPGRLLEHLESSVQFQTLTDGSGLLVFDLVEMGLHFPEAACVLEPAPHETDSACFRCHATRGAEPRGYGVQQ